MQSNLMISTVVSRGAGMAMQNDEGIVAERLASFMRQYSDDKALIAEKHKTFVTLTDMRLYMAENIPNAKDIAKEVASHIGTPSPGSILDSKTTIIVAFIMILGGLIA